MLKRIFFTIALLLLAGCSNAVDVTNSAGTLSPTPTKTIVLTKHFPDVELSELNTGRSIRFSQIKKPISITFWATWCTTCKQEMPLWRNPKLADTMIGINVQDASASRGLTEAAINLMNTNGTSFPSYVDTNEVLTSKLGIIGLPVTIVVDKDGTIIKRKDGVLSQQELLSFINFD